jgi:hypothetical protein
MADVLSKDEIGILLNAINADDGKKSRVQSR